MASNPSSLGVTSEFYQQMISPEPLERNQLVINTNQVAGHAGFYSLIDTPDACLKPFNTSCLRGRREHLFYQLIEYSNQTTTPEATSETTPSDKRTNLCYKDFTLMTYPSPATSCKCIIDEALLKSLSSFVPKFYHVKHLTNDAMPPSEKAKLKTQCQDLILPKHELCPCYGGNAKEKYSCSKDYEKVNFLCLRDLTAQCQNPCIIDIKIGQITYDPFAIKEKVLEQSGKYKRQQDLGFRILGMKLGDKIVDASFGKTLETDEQVYNALDSFFQPLEDEECKHLVIERMLSTLRKLLLWFNRNNSQLRFYSSSLLMIYDSHIQKDPQGGDVKAKVLEKVRLSMIDFAHVFHVHDLDQNQKDENCIFGLKKLEEFYVKLLQHHPLPPRE